MYAAGKFHNCADPGPEESGPQSVGAISSPPQDRQTPCSLPWAPVPAHNLSSCSRPQPPALERQMLTNFTSYFIKTGRPVYCVTSCAQGQITSPPPMLTSCLRPCPLLRGCLTHPPPGQGACPTRPPNPASTPPSSSCLIQRPCVRWIPSF